MLLAGIALSAAHQPSATATHELSFAVPYPVLQKTLEADIASQHQTVKVNWVDLLACLAAQYQGDFSLYCDDDLNRLLYVLQAGSSIERLAAPYPDYPSYRQLYGAVLDGLTGYEDTVAENGSGQAAVVSSYGLKGCFPLADGVSYEHYDDFGAERTYGYVRPHLGHDLLCAVGTPIVAVEDGTIEAIGWNRYGGWRIGIRSNDRQRYYYYAHMQEDHPYHPRCYLGAYIHAGEVIGYVGRTGYSETENVSNISVPHLHIGLEIILDEQERNNGHEIWIDLYALTTLLEQHKTEVRWNSTSKEFDACAP